MKWNRWDFCHRPTSPGSYLFLGNSRECGIMYVGERKHDRFLPYDARYLEPVEGQMEDKLMYVWFEWGSSCELDEIEFWTPIEFPE